EARYADALVALAGRHIADDSDPDRATVVVHADAATLTGELDNGVQVASSTVGRLLCGGRVQLVFDGRDGRPVGVGRMMRTPRGGWSAWSVAGMGTSAVSRGEVAPSSWTSTTCGTGPKV